MAQEYQTEVTCRACGTEIGTVRMHFDHTNTGATLAAIIDPLLSNHREKADCPANQGWRIGEWEKTSQVTP